MEESYHRNEVSICKSHTLNFICTIVSVTLLLTNNIV